MEREKEYQLRNFFFSRRRRRRRRRKNYSFSIQSGLECVCMFVSWRGDLLRSSTARVFFSKFIEDVCVCVCVYIGRASSRISSWLSSSFRANTVKKKKKNAGRQRRRRRLLGGHYCCRYPSFYWLRYCRRWAELWRAVPRHYSERDPLFCWLSHDVKGVLKREDRK